MFSENKKNDSGLLIFKQKSNFFFNTTKTTQL